MRPRRSAVARLRRVRPTPTTCLTARAFFNASANEPPISPTPITTSLPILSLSGMTGYSGKEHEPQRRKDAKVHKDEQEHLSFSLVPLRSLCVFASLR
jgi:hypothetical protein